MTNLRVLNGGGSANVPYLFLGVWAHFFPLPAYHMNGQQILSID